MTAPQLRASGLEAGYAAEPILHGVDLALAPGQITAIVGPNACGKSTLLRALSRLLAPRQGGVTLDDTPVQRIAPKALARRLGFLPQTPIAPEGITVHDLVGRGRHPHQGLFARWSVADEKAVAAALAATDTTDLAERDVTELSGGQRQRVWIAMALAQETEILLLDEPTTFLDINHQIEVLELLTALNRSRGITIVMVLHELNLAARYADHLVGMKTGRIHVAGPPDEVLTARQIKALFGLDCLVIPDPVSGKPMMIPRGRSSAVAALAEEARC